MTGDTLYLDTETYSPLDIRKVGTYRYAENCEIMLATYALNDGPVACWDHTEGLPLELPMGVRVVAHNAMFDRNALRLGNARIDIPIERWECTMTQAYQHALPGSIGALGELLGLAADNKKLKEGEKLINRFCKPAPGNHKAARYDRYSHPEEWARFKQYAIQDVVAMREIHKLLPTWNWQPDDISLWHLDQRINDRGFKVDMDLVRAGASAAAREKQSIARRFAELTHGLRPTQRAKVQEFINTTYGLSLCGTAKPALKPIADNPDAPATLREIANLILSANKTSTAKYARMAEAVSEDGRFRGGLQFSGASRTRRWAGRVFQPQNLPSRGLPPEGSIALYIEALKAGVHDRVFDDLMLYGSAALRGVVTA